MVNVGKYKLLAALTGTGGGAYGSYEIYNRYGRTSASATGTASGEEVSVRGEQKAQEQPVAEEQVVEGNKEESSEKDEAKNEEQKLEENGDGEEAKEAAPSVEEEEQEKVQQDEEKEPQAEEPAQVQAEEAVEEPQGEKKPEEESAEQPSKPEETQPQNPASSTQRNRRNPSQPNFTNPDGSFIIKSGSVGEEFKNYVITSVKDTTLWGQKVSAWAEDTRYFKEKERDRNYRQVMPSQFTLKSWEKMENSELQRRCSNAYNKNRKNWGDMPKLSTDAQRKYDPTTRAREYWAMVWKYCGQPMKDTPAG